MQVSAGAGQAWAKRPETADKTLQKEAFGAKARQLFDDRKHLEGGRRRSAALKKPA
jgi:hypothetical protein